MKVCANSKVYDVQKDRVLGFIVQHNGRTLFPESRGYQVAVAEFKRLAEDNAHAAKETAARASAA